MNDAIFWGNLKGLLKSGKWNLNLEEASALVQIYQEAVTRSQPLKVKENEPIKKVKNGK